MTPTIELLRSHRSIRHFTDAPVSDEQRAEIIASAQAASTSSFLQCTSIIRITDPALRERLVPLTGGQQHVLPLFGLCLGWPADNPDIKPRMPAAMLVHENRYQPLDNALLAEYDEQLAHYYLSRGSNARRDTGATISGALS